LANKNDTKNQHKRKCEIIDYHIKLECVKRSNKKTYEKPKWELSKRQSPNRKLLCTIWKSCCKNNPQK